MSLLLFLIQVVIISLSGVMAPGPVTAAAIAMGARSRYAGLALAIGHAIIEVPLIILIMFGIDKLLKATNTQMIIGLAGGTFLLLMAFKLLRNLNNGNSPQYSYFKTTPILTGFILSAGNPYFLLWWATIGLALATSARQLGIWAFVLFAVVHWLCDCAWFQALSWASFKGTGLLGPRSQRIVLLICSLFLIGFGLFFIYNAAGTLLKIILT